MDRLTSLRVFREVVDAGSFAAAAARLDISPPMASKHVAQLERSLGARLLHRSSRHLSLTEAGRAWYEQSGRALDLLDAAEAAIGQRNEAPRGQLKVSAPVWCATRRPSLCASSSMARMMSRSMPISLMPSTPWALSDRTRARAESALVGRPNCG